MNPSERFLEHARRAVSPLYFKAMIQSRSAGPGKIAGGLRIMDTVHSLILLLLLHWQRSRVGDDV